MPKRTEPTEEDRAKARERSRRFEERHPEKKKEYYEANRERLKKAANERYHANKDRILEQMKEYRARPDVKERHNAWVAQYTAKDAYKHGIAANARAYRTGIRKDTFMTMFHMQNGLCGVCGCSLPEKLIHTDHCHDTGNIRGLLCQSCNTTEGRIRATGLDPLEFCQRLHDYLTNPPAKELGLIWKPKVPSKERQ